MNFFICSLLIVVIYSCSFTNPVTINYLDQPDPGMKSELFARGTISTGLSEHSAPAFSPDGSVVLWTVMDKSYRGAIYEMKYSDGVWSRPGRPSFADSTADDFYPSFSPDGQKVYFSSRRKMPAGYVQGKDISMWVVARKDGKWGEPVPFDTTISRGREYAHSISSKGTMFWSATPDTGKDMNIFRSVLRNGRYQAPQLLPPGINTAHYEDGPYISDDESFLIFESDRPGGIGESIDLYIAFRKADGTYSLPVNLGPAINTEHAERFAGLSPDGKYLFFGSGRNMNEENWGFDIFWISADVINSLKTQGQESDKK